MGFSCCHNGSNSITRLVTNNYLCVNFVTAKVEEELNTLSSPTATKLTNQMFVAAANSNEVNMNSLNAATFISVVRI